ncbi:MAG: hypothetical protein ABIT09_06850 [Croceibacterium sp.]
MGSKRFDTIGDFIRHGHDIEIACYCGHKAILPAVKVALKFTRESWPLGLGLATRHFRCSKCGSSPSQIGPMRRD